MNYIDIIAIILILLCAGVSVRYIRRKKSCCGSCDKCDSIKKCK